MPEEQNQKQSNEITPQDRKEKNPTRLTLDDINRYLENEQKRAEPKDVIMQWEADEFKQVTRPQQWYILFAVVAIIFVVYAIFTANYLFALVIVILAIVLNQFFHKQPGKITVAITREGIAINNNFYAYGQNLTSFWILYNPPDIKTLTLALQSAMQPNIVIQLEDQNPLKVRETLLNYLPEDIEKEEGQIDATFRRWGF